jgi:hypothetical protein
MKPIASIVYGVSLFLLFYTIAPYLDISGNILFLLFLLGQFFVVYLVYMTLRYGNPTDKTFEDGHWYEDYSPFITPGNK